MSRKISEHCCPNLGEKDIECHRHRRSKVKNGFLDKQKICWSVPVTERDVITIAVISCVESRYIDSWLTLSHKDKFKRSQESQERRFSTV